MVDAWVVGISIYKRFTDSLQHGRLLESFHSLGLYTRIIRDTIFILILHKCLHSPVLNFHQPLSPTLIPSPHPLNPSPRHPAVNVHGTHSSPHLKHLLPLSPLVLPCARLSPAPSVRTATLMLRCTMFSQALG
jgi:hypothetical protein